MTSSPRPYGYVADDRRKPHVHPLCTAAGHLLTTVEPADHPWQRGLWFAVKYVDGDNFWEELPPYGVQRHVAGDTLHWIRPDRETVAIVEHRTLTFTPMEDSTYAIDWETTLVPPVDTVLDRTEFTTWGGYGGLSLRGRPDWEDTRIRLDRGNDLDRAVGVPSRWIDLTGVVDGSVVGISILDHPANPRHPVPWYASTIAGPGYGDGWANFVNAAFLFHAPMPVAADTEVRFRYRVVVHDGAVSSPTVGAWWDRWASV